MIKKVGSKKKSKKVRPSEESSALAKTLQDFAAQQNRGPVTLSIDKDIYQKAQQQFGKRKISAIVEAALKDILSKMENSKKEDGEKIDEPDEEK